MKEIVSDQNFNLLHVNAMRTDAFAAERGQEEADLGRSRWKVREGPTWLYGCFYEKVSLYESLPIWDLYQEP